LSQHTHIYNFTKQNPVILYLQNRSVFKFHICYYVQIWCKSRRKET